MFGIVWPPTLTPPCNLSRFASVCVHPVLQTGLAIFGFREHDGTASQAR